MPIQALSRALALALGVLLAGCGSLMGETYWIPGVEGGAREQQEFYGIVDGIARKRGLLPIRCEESRTAASCWRYRSGDGVFLEGRIVPHEGRYQVTVYEPDARKRSPKALEIEAEAVAALRGRFGDKVVKRPSANQDRRQP